MDFRFPSFSSPRPSSNTNTNNNSSANTNASNTSRHQSPADESTPLLSNADSSSTGSPSRTPIANPTIGQTHVNWMAAMANKALDAGRGFVQHGQALYQNTASRLHSYQMSQSFPRLQGEIERRVITNISDTSTYNDKDALVRAAQERKQQTIHRAAEKQLLYASIDRDENFSSAKPTTEGICAGVRAGIVNRVFSRQNTAFENAKDYAAGADLFAEAFQAVSACVHVNPSNLGSLNNFLASLEQPLNDDVKAILNQIYETELFEIRSNDSCCGCWGTNNEQLRLAIDTNDRLPAINPPFKTGIEKKKLKVDAVLRSLRTLQTGQLTQRQRTALEYAIALISVLEKPKETSYNTPILIKMFILHHEYKVFLEEQYLYNADRIAVSKVQGINSSALFANDAAFLQQIRHLDAGCYAINLISGKEGHAIGLQVLPNGEVQLADPNGPVIRYNNLSNALTALNTLLQQFYYPPILSDSSRPEPRRNEANNTHFISILRYDPEGT